MSVLLEGIGYHINKTKVLLSELTLYERDRQVKCQIVTNRFKKIKHVMKQRVWGKIFYEEWSGEQLPLTIKMIMDR